MMKAALVGFGTISIVHIDAIASNPGMELVAICDINEELAAKVPAGVKFYTDYKKMAEDASYGQNIGVSASTSVLPMNTQD